MKVVFLHKAPHAKAAEPTVFDVNANSPCPCGSGKKFKRCHSGKVPTLAEFKAQQKKGQKDGSRRLYKRHMAKLKGRARTIRRLFQEDEGLRFWIHTVEDVKHDAITRLEALDDFLPTAEQINALPEPIRMYIHNLETRTDPAGDVAALTLMRDQNAMLCEYMDVTFGEVGELVRRTEDRQDVGLTPCEHARMASGLKGLFHRVEELHGTTEAADEHDPDAT